jgi:hypothetical protein
MTRELNLPWKVYQKNGIVDAAGVSVAGTHGTTMEGHRDTMSIASSATGNIVKEVLVSEGTRAMARSPEWVAERRRQLAEELESVQGHQAALKGFMADLKSEILVASARGLDSRAAAAKLAKAADQKRDLQARRMAIQNEQSAIGREYSSDKLDYGQYLTAILAEVRQLTVEVRRMAGQEVKS